MKRLDTWILFFLGLILFGIGIEYPTQLNFDEFHYIPAARQFLAGVGNPNWEHPPLGKLIIALGIQLFGDSPLGWRSMSLVFGALTWVGLYQWGHAVFGRRKSAWTVALLGLAGQMLFVQARIAMLDTFMVAFLVFALANYAQGKHSRAALFFGAASACKWSALIPWACFGLWAGFREGGGLVAWLHWVRVWGVQPLLVYYAPFLIFLRMDLQPPATLVDIFWNMQWRIWEGQQRVVAAHPYASHWWEWPLLLKPIWYAFERESSPQNGVRGVFLLGNPLLLWGGLLAWLACLWGYFRERSLAAGHAAAVWAVLYFGWVLIPRKLAFHYYYYPAALSLSLCWTWLLDRLETSRPNGDWKRWVLVGSALALFLWFLPISAAWRLGPDTFRTWMWFDRWI